MTKPWTIFIFLICFPIYLSGQATPTPVTNLVINTTISEDLDKILFARFRNQTIRDFILYTNLTGVDAGTYDLSGKALVVGDFSISDRISLGLLLASNMGATNSFYGVGVSGGYIDPLFSFYGCLLASSALPPFLGIVPFGIAPVFVMDFDSIGVFEKISSFAYIGNIITDFDYKLHWLYQRVDDYLRLGNGLEILRDAANLIFNPSVNADGEIGQFYWYCGIKNNMYYAEGFFPSLININDYMLDMKISFRKITQDTGIYFFNNGDLELNLKLATNEQAVFFSFITDFYKASLGCTLSTPFKTFITINECVPITGGSSGDPYKDYKSPIRNNRLSKDNTNADASE